MRWLVQNLRRPASFAFNNLRHAADTILRELTRAAEKVITHATETSARRVREPDARVFRDQRRLRKKLA